MTDVVIIGAGVAGTLAATLLHRRGIAVTLLDAKHPCAPTFKCEALGKDQVNRLRKLEVLEPVRRRATPIHSYVDAWMGVNVRSEDTEHYGIMYHDLVNTFRDNLPDGVDFRIARVAAIEPSDGRQTVVLDQGETLRPKLVVLATGHAQKLANQLGLSKRLVSSPHSFALGLTIESTEPEGFSFEELSYWGDREDSDIALATFFRVDGQMRLNIFTYWGANDPRVSAMARSPDEEVFRVMPGLRKAIGGFRVISAVDRFAFHLSRIDERPVPGVVAIGDAHSTVCAATGTGLTKVLNDVELLTEVHAPQWLKADAVDGVQIAEFYHDRRKVKLDRDVLDLSLWMRRTALDRGLTWRLRRGARRVKRQVWSTAARLSRKSA